LPLFSSGPVFDDFCVYFEEVQFPRVSGLGFFEAPPGLSFSSQGHIELVPVLNFLFFFCFFSLASFVFCFLVNIGTRIVLPPFRLYFPSAYKFPFMSTGYSTVNLSSYCEHPQSFFFFDSEVAALTFLLSFLPHSLILSLSVGFLHPASLYALFPPLSSLPLQVITVHGDNPSLSFSHLYFFFFFFFPGPFSLRFSSY